MPPPTYDYPFIRPEIRRSLEAYHFQHRPTGGFLEAVIRNDLSRAISQADEMNSDYFVLKDLVWYCHDALPAIALDFDAWTTCRCRQNGKDIADCRVHSFPEEIIRSWEVA